MTEIDDFLADYAPPIAAHVQALRELVMQAVPEAIERLRPGWRLIGYDLPRGRRTTYFAWIWPESEHVHVGWQVGTLLADPRGQLRGAHLKLKKARYLTMGPADTIDRRAVIGFTRDAARIATLPLVDRQLIALARSA